MNIEILQKKIKEGLAVVGRGISRSSSLPTLKNVHISTDGNYLCLTTTDLEIAVRWWALVDVKTKGEFLTNYEVINSFTNHLPADKVQLSVSGSKLSIKCKDYNTETNGFDCSEYPVIPEVEEKGKIVLSSKILHESLIRVVDIPSDSRIKPEISGVLFSYQDKELSFVATDTYRLAEKKVDIKQSIDNFSFIIPQRTVREVVNIFKDIDSDVEIIFNDNQVVFRVLIPESTDPYIELTSKVIEGNYPDYKRIIPRETDSKIIVDREDFLNKVKAGSVFSSKVREVSFKVSPKNKMISIESSNNDIGNYSSTITGEGEGKDTDVSFNYRFIIDGLSNITSSEVSFEINDDNKPGMIKPVGKSDYIYVIMPIKK